ncbi:uncharacterized protein LOC117105430 isoform X2 [Anneissia japonica]|uniref:uncharacterized protein LOC117105430 isoform X2 n=1 Tax=Anneissia japonica TaxID=1529436 RepID=UPI001425A0C5|nr:uncharacterized protein LOC117105430 isoform X2 [Anneissia japonica]
MAVNTQGNWFASGYHGHFRSRSRNDFVNEYRNQSKPSPPQKFSKLLKERPTIHHFSKHDNRFSFLNTVDSFQDGLGKKKVQSNYKSRFSPDFISWVPHKKEIIEAGPAYSSYRDAFRRSQGEVISQNLLHSVNIPKSSNLNTVRSAPALYPELDVESKPLTTYNFVHQHLQPNPSVNTNMYTGKVNDEPPPLEKSFEFINPRHKSIYDRPREGLTNLRRSRVKSAPFMRTTVADCLNWYRGPEKETIESLDYSKRAKTAFDSCNTEQVPMNSTLSAGGDRHQRPVQTVATAPVTASEFNGNNISTTLNLPMRALKTIGNEPDVKPSSTKSTHFHENTCTRESNETFNQSTSSQSVAALVQ